MLDDDLKKWFAEPEYRPDWQDIHLILADAKYLSQLACYLEDVKGVEMKKFMVVFALLELLEHPDTADAPLTAQITSILIRHWEIAEKSILILGPIPGVMIQRLFGKVIPSDIPQWVIERADEKLRGGLEANSPFPHREEGF